MKINKNLNKAKKEKNDEFYTLIEDIEKELIHYKEHLRDKVVFCNCDDPEWSNFWKYFILNFKDLGLKKLISTHYKEDNISSYGLIFEGEYKSDGTPNTKKFELKGNGDFKSEECIELLKECDIVITNPPFSLFRSYVALLLEHKKDFLIIGNQNAITYKEIFPLFKDDLLWMGYNFVKNFKKPDGTLQSFGNICWFTNIDIKKRHIELELTKKYNEKDFPKYDNYNIINVNKLTDIPSDYEGVMGVPITYIEKYNPKQFKILGIANSARWIGYECFTIINKKRIYNRILIQKI